MSDTRNQTSIPGQLRVEIFMELSCKREPVEAHEPIKGRGVRSARRDGTAVESVPLLRGHRAAVAGVKSIGQIHVLVVCPVGC